MNFKLTQYLYNSADFSVQLQTMETFPPASASYPRMKDEKIEASSEEGRRETQSVRDCSGSLNNFKIRVSNKADHSQIMGIYYLMTNSRQRKWCIGSTTVFDFFSMLYKNQDEESRCHACVKSLLSLSVSELVL